MRYLAQIIGNIPIPTAISKYGNFDVGVVRFMNNIFKVLIVIAGVYALLNMLFAGLQFMSASGDSKAVEKAFAKIWQSLIGLLIVAGAFVLAAVFGWLLFGDPGAILNPAIYGP
jgi:hypothetical protein